MALPGEIEAHEIGEKIKAAAVAKGIDLNDPKHEYTLWSDLGSHFQYSGSYGPDIPMPPGLTAGTTRQGRKST